MLRNLFRRVSDLFAGAGEATDRRVIVHHKDLHPLPFSFDSHSLPPGLLLRETSPPPPRRLLAVVCHDRGGISMSQVQGVRPSPWRSRTLRTFAQ